MRILVTGAGGFISGHLVTRLKADGHYVFGADIKLPEFHTTDVDRFFRYDLRDPELCRELIEEHQPDQVYTLAADMGGAQYVFSGNHDAAIMRNSAMINLNMARLCSEYKVKVLYTSSACMYPAYNQTDPDNPNCSEGSAYPAAPDSEYGWEKLFSERLYLAHARNEGLDVRIARLHNIFGPLGTYEGGREKAPAAMCRKVALAKDEIEVWGDGLQTRSFLYVDECVEGLIRLMNSDFKEPVNLGSEEMVTINELAQMVIDISGKDIRIKNVPTDVQGVRGRNSDNTLIRSALGWEPKYALRDGLEKTYRWIESKIV